MPPEKMDKVELRDDSQAGGQAFDSSPGERRLRELVAVLLVNSGLGLGSES